MFSDNEKNMWKAAGNGGAKLTDGEYRGFIKSVAMKAMKDGSRKLLVEYEVDGPAEFKGLTYTHFMGMEGDKQMYYTKVALLKLGINVDVELDDLVNEVRKHEGESLSFVLATEGKYQNCTILEGRGAVARASNDDIPF